MKKIQIIIFFYISEDEVVGGHRPRGCSGTSFFFNFFLSWTLYLATNLYKYVVTMHCESLLLNR